MSAVPTTTLVAVLAGAASADFTADRHLGNIADTYWYWRRVSSHPFPHSIAEHCHHDKSCLKVAPICSSAQST